MAPNPRRQDERLDALYAQLPRLDCQGYCHDSCGPIETSLRERQRIEKAAGKTLTCERMGAECSMLTEDRRCSVYEIRPMICRLWGILDVLKCPYGCVPEGGWITSDEGARLMMEADQIGGVPDRREERLLRETLKAIGDEEAARRAGSHIRKTTQRPTLAGRSLPPTIIDRRGQG